MSGDWYQWQLPHDLPEGDTIILFICLCQVTGIDGNYLMTCQKVMSVLRENKESLMAVLEAFVYDPLLSWGLTDAHKTKAVGKGGSKSGLSVVSQRTIMASEKFLFFSMG